MGKSVINFATHEGRAGQRRLADLPDRVVEGDPQHETVSHFESDDGSVLAGTWTSTPGKWHAFTDRDEFCYIISGHCQLISDAGEVQDFQTGDAFLIPNGFKGFWNVIETTTKHYVIRDYAIS
ncbi:cupin domain-containing protein [uncultured Roseovarius sp.]|uniref:cupin domain-containing protein n=1 Tax=uncultured Roseovarius sp. TaxID=293344 RepID=UPI00262FA6E4|nr:cupin domain-containing protein [uncultured Roseovarius sp.]